MEPGKIKILKAKNWKTYDNPNDMEMEFKLILFAVAFFLSIIICSKLKQ